MRSRFILLAFALAGGAGVVSSGALAAQPAAPPSPLEASWKAVAASGPVESLLRGAVQTDWRRVARGDDLLPLSQVRTGRRGRVTLTRYASVLIVDPQSRVELPATYEGTSPSVVQTSGSVIYEIDGRKVNGFRVVTPYLVAGVKGTVFLVTVNERFTAVSVEEGTVSLSSDAMKESRDIHEGETAVLSAEEGAELEIIRQGQDGEERREGASREARQIARREAEKIEERDPLPADARAEVDGGQALQDDAIIDPVDDVLSRPELGAETDPVALDPTEAVDPLTEEVIQRDPKSDATRVP